MTRFIMRKPLVSLFFLGLLVFEVIFTGCLKRGIERDMQTIEDMYDNAVITYQALPESLGDLTLRPHFGDNLERMDEFDKICSYMSCPYTIRKPMQAINVGWMYGTEQLDWFSKNQMLTYYVDGTAVSETKFADWNEHTEEVPCIVEDKFLEYAGLAVGDSFVGASYGFHRTDSPNSPDINLHIVGYYTNDDDALEDNSIIVPLRIFLEPPAILFNTSLLESCCMFRQYEVTIKQEYNRQADEIEDKIVQYFEKAGVLVHSDSRILKKAVHPIEQRLKIQKALEKPLEIALAVAASLLAVLMAIGIQNDIFLFLLFGESKAKAFLKCMGSLAVIIGVSALVAIAGSLIVLGFGWFKVIALYSAAVVLLCLIAASVPVLFFCNRNLVNFYQTKEA